MLMFIGWFFLFVGICLLLASSGGAPDLSLSGRFPRASTAHAWCVSVCQLAMDWAQLLITFGRPTALVNGREFGRICDVMYVWMWCIYAGFVWDLCSPADPWLGIQSGGASDMLAVRTVLEQNFSVTNQLYHWNEMTEAFEGLALCLTIFDYYLVFFFFCFMKL